MGGKGSAPAAPDYTPVANADAQSAQLEYQLGQQQLAWGQQQFNTVWPYAQNYLNQQTASSAAETGTAQQQEQFYQGTYQPIESQFAGEAQNYNSPARSNQQAGAAMADVTNQFNASRAAALQQLESFGIDPSQTRYGALDLSSRVSQAAATAAAGTQSKLNTEATGLALQGEAINIGRGYPNSVAQSYNTATNSGSSGINTANSTIGTGSSITGTPTQYMGLSNASLAGETQALNTGFNNQLAGAKFNAQQQANTLGGIGSLIGGGLGLAAAML